jgi:hypothetical protein
MIVMAVISGILVMVVVLAAVHNHRHRGTGRRAWLSTEEAFQRRLDAKARDKLSFMGGQDWTNPVKHNPRRSWR